MRSTPLLRLARVAACVLLAACASDTAGDGPARDDGRADRNDNRTPAADAGALPDVAIDTGSVPDGSGSGTATDAGADAEPDAAPDVAPDTADAGADTAPDVPAPVERGSVAGRVWAPGNAPGMVPAQQEIPVAGAMVSLQPTRPDPIPQEAYCQACETIPRGAVFSEPDGTFVLDAVPVGTYWLVIEKGQFRVEQEVVVVADALLELTADETTMPSQNAPDLGMTTPRIALAAGSFDHLEDILGKMGLGDVDADGLYVPMSANGVIDVFDNGSGDFGSVAAGTLGDLVRDLDRLLDYHILFIPCSGGSHTSALQDQQVLRNLREYVAAGGNLYVTDWSGEWHDNVFPAHVELEGGGGGFLDSGTDTPASAYDPATNTWNTSEFGDADGSSYDTPNGYATDDGLRAWLDGQVGPTASSDAASVYDASHFEVEGSWNTIMGVHEVQVGTDRNDDPIYDTPRVWVEGGTTFSPMPRRPLTVTYEPVGCGRVLYSTYHTTDDRHVGLAPQERVLLYLIMEIGTCRDPKR